MKVFVFATIAWALTAAASYGQIEAVEHGSAVAAANLQNYMRDRADANAAYDKAIESGRNLFGVDERWEKALGIASSTTKVPQRASRKPVPVKPKKRSREEEILAGKLLSEMPPDFKIGDWGCTNSIFQVVNKVSDTECLVLPKWKGSEVMLIRGVDMSKVTDGAEFILQYPVVIHSTYDYTTVEGAKKTVLVLDHNDAEFNKVTEPVLEKPIPAKVKATVQKAPQEASEPAKLRTWKDATGMYHIEAKYDGVIAGNVKLIKPGGSTLKLPLEKLSDEDREWIKKRSK